MPKLAKNSTSAARKTATNAFCVPSGSRGKRCALWSFHVSFTGSQSAAVLPFSRMNAVATMEKAMDTICAIIAFDRPENRWNSG